MTIFILLGFIFGLLYLISRFGVKSFNSVLTRGRVAAGFTFVFAGILHFVAPQPFLKMMPSFLPYPSELVMISGIFEILGGLSLILGIASRVAGIGLILLLLAVLPANINVAVNNLDLGGYMSHPVYQWIRIPFQLVLIIWVYYFAVRK